MIKIEVAFATPELQRIVVLELPEGSTARDAAKSSALDQDFEGLVLGVVPLGVFGHTVDDDYVLKQGDRVEMYRPLQIDPKEARRLRAQKNPKSLNGL